MKKLLVIFFFFSFLFSNNLNIIPPNSYYTYSNINKAYAKLLAYEETNKLIEVLNELLNNTKFKEYLYFEEMGKVKVSTLALLKQLRNFLNGWPKYTNTYFENNSDTAGIKKILEDSIENDTNFLNLPQKVIDDMKNSIRNSRFFDIADKIKSIDKKNVKEIMKYLNMLISSYVDTLSKVNVPLLTNFDENIKDLLEKDYRIYAKTDLVSTMEIFKNFIDQNYKALQ